MYPIFNIKFSCLLYMIALQNIWALHAISFQNNLKQYQKTTLPSSYKYES